MVPDAKKRRRNKDGLSGAKIRRIGGKQGKSSDPRKGIRAAEAEALDCVEALLSSLTLIDTKDARSTVRLIASLIQEFVRDKEPTSPQSARACEAAIYITHPPEERDFQLLRFWNATGAHSPLLRNSLLIRILQQHLLRGDTEACAAFLNAEDNRWLVRGERLTESPFGAACRAWIAVCENSDGATSQKTDLPELDRYGSTMLRFDVEPPLIFQRLLFQRARSVSQDSHSVHAYASSRPSVYTGEMSFAIQLEEALPLLSALPLGEQCDTNVSELPPLFISGLEYLRQSGGDALVLNSVWQSHRSLPPPLLLFLITDYLEYNCWCPLGWKLLLHVLLYQPHPDGVAVLNMPTLRSPAPQLSKLPAILEFLSYPFVERQRSERVALWRRVWEMEKKEKKSLRPKKTPTGCPRVINRKEEWSNRYFSPSRHPRAVSHDPFLASCIAVLAAWFSNDAITVVNRVAKTLPVSTDSHEDMKPLIKHLMPRRFQKEPLAIQVAAVLLPYLPLTPPTE